MYPRAVDLVVGMLDRGEVPQEWEVRRNRFVMSGELRTYESASGNVNDQDEFGCEREEQVRSCIRCEEFYLARENGVGSCVRHAGLCSLFPFLASNAEWVTDLL